MKYGRSTSADARAKWLEKRWSQICPKIFQATDPNLLPDQEAYKLCMCWTYNPTGLLLYGPTRSGKSRTAWLLVRREFFAGRKVGVIDSMSGIQYASRYSESATAVEGWILAKLQSDLLLLDDPFKSKLTDSYESAIFTIIERFTLSGKPLILTSNDIGTSLGRRMSQDRSDPLVARLREFCSSFEFKIAVEENQKESNG